MRKIFIFLLLFLLAIGQARAVIKLAQPKEKMLTFDEVVSLQGEGKAGETFRLNDKLLQVKPDGKISYGLVLHSGKNYAQLQFADTVKGLRILKLKTFPDIEELYDGKKHWARSQIIHLATLGYIEGYTDDNFYPGNPVTRGELATWIARAKGMRPPALAADVFFDVPKEHWRAPYIKSVVDAGFMKGYDKENFGIDEPLSRRQAAEVAVLTEGYEVVERIKPLFVDVPKEEKGAFPIYIAKEKGLVIGVSKDISVFDPDRALTRAEAAVMVSRFQHAGAQARDLFNYEFGYSPMQFCTLNAVPEILSFSAEPNRARVGQQAVIQLRVQLVPREGFYPISKVKVDLSELGGMPDAEMYDDVTQGDAQKEDLLYSLNVQLDLKQSGDKKIVVTAIDRLGWEGKKQTYLMVVN